VSRLGRFFLSRTEREAVIFGKYKAASNPYTNFVTLRELANSKSTKVRSAVAANPNSQAYIINQLAIDSNETVRSHVAKNPNITLDAWKKLKVDASEAVRKALAETHPEQPAARGHRG
jgi:hypothetical protein